MVESLPYQKLFCNYIAQVLRDTITLTSMGKHVEIWLEKNHLRNHDECETMLFKLFGIPENEYNDFSNMIIQEWTTTVCADAHQSVMILF